MHEDPMEANPINTEGDINLSDQRNQWVRDIRLHEETRQLLDRDARVFLHQSMSTPCLDVLGTSDGCVVENLQGLSYLDFHGNNVHQVGHANAFVIDRIRKQLDQLAFSPRRFTNETAVLLAEKLTGLLPGDLNRVLFAPGGSSVVGIALKLARVVTGRHKVVSYWDSFHGAGLEAIAAGGEAVFRKHLGPMMPGTLRIPPPMRKGGVFEDEMKAADHLEYVIEKEGEIGAFIAETIRNTDVQIPSRKYWKRIREICDRHHIVLILDEIPIALGRTGRMFAFEHYEIEPDILCLGKGLGGGIVPFAAMVCRDSYNVARDISLGHFTHEKSPLGCAAAHAALDFIEERHLLQKVVEDGDWMQEKLRGLREKQRYIGEVRGMGLLWGISLEDPKTHAPAFEIAEKTLYACLRRGLSFKVSQGHVLQWSPALTISRDQLQHALDILDRALTETTSDRKAPLSPAKPSNP